MNILTLAGDALWIAALSIMAGASREAWRRMDPETRVPMQFRADGAPLWRARRAPALLAIPGAAFVVSLLLVAFNRNMVAVGDQALILFGVRATAAAVFALYHLRWLKSAMAVLAQEGALRP
ncbi:MAG: hypothetical protein ABI655_04675 [Phenylobacterium sp.]